MIFIFLNNLRILNQAELMFSPATIDMNSGKTEIMSIKPLTLKMYDNLP